VEVNGSTQWLQAGSGNLSQHTKALHFGLGDAPSALSVRILWPSGARQEFRNLAAGFLYEITEGSDRIRRQPFATGSAIAPVRIAAADNLPRAHDTWLIEPVPLPDGRAGPGLLYVSAGEKPSLTDHVNVVDLRLEPADVAAGYALFRRYILDWRPPLDLPLLLLIDGANRVHRLYAAVPDAATLAADLQRLSDGNRQRIALPFAGDYVGLPRRNYFKLGAAFYWAGYPEQALPYLDEVVRRAPENDKALNAVGQIHLEAGRWQTARPYLERAVAANPRLGEAWNNLGGVESAAGDLRAAMRNYERAIEMLPKSGYPLVNAGEVAAQMGDSGGADKLFRRAMEIDPKDPEPPNQAGMLAARLGRNGEAKEWFQKAITLRPAYAGAINNLGVLYLQMGQPNDAIAAFEYGIGVAPEDELLYMNLGRTYIQRGDREKARETMLRLLRQNPQSATAKSALRELEGR
jgi:tetratricopeptide (TPR) repeat protein